MNKVACAVPRNSTFFPLLKLSFQEVNFTCYEFKSLASGGLTHVNCTVPSLCASDLQTRFVGSVFRVGFPTKIAKLDFRENFAKIFDSIFGVNIFAKIDRHLNPLTSSYQQ